MRSFLVIILLGFVITHCARSDRKKGEGKFIEPNQIVDASDSSYLSQYTLTCTDSHLIATDAKSNKVYIFDYEGLNIVKTFGRDGSGPGEFKGAHYSAAAEGNLYVSDVINQKISIFNQQSWTYQSTIPVSRILTRFAVSSKSIYLSSPFLKQGAPLMKVNKDDRNIDYFGEGFAHVFPGRNLFHTFIYKDKVIAISKSEPIIHFYDKKGKFISKYNFENEIHLTETLKFINKFYKNSENYNRVVTLFNDAAIFEDYLILNFFSRPDERLKTNNYLVYKIEGNTLEKETFFETNIGDEGITHTFCIYGNTLFSNGGQGGIDIYKFDISSLFIDQ